MELVRRIQLWIRLFSSFVSLLFPLEGFFAYKRFMVPPSSLFLLPLVSLKEILSLSFLSHLNSFVAPVLALQGFFQPFLGIYAQICHLEFWFSPVDTYSAFCWQVSGSILCILSWDFFSFFESRSLFGLLLIRGCVSLSKPTSQLKWLGSILSITFHSLS